MGRVFKGSLETTKNQIYATHGEAILENNYLKRHPTYSNNFCYFLLFGKIRDVFLLSLKIDLKTKGWLLLFMVQNVYAFHKVC